MTTTLLTETDLDAIRNELLTARAELTAQVATLADADAELTSARASQEERAKSAGDADLLGVERNVVARMSRTMEEGLADLDAALERLDAGTYGTCSRCYKLIPPARLLARPRATTCVTCTTR